MDDDHYQSMMIIFATIFIKDQGVFFLVQSHDPLFKNDHAIVGGH